MNKQYICNNCNGLFSKLEDPEKSFYKRYKCDSCQLGFCLKKNKLHSFIINQNNITAYCQHHPENYFLLYSSDFEKPLYKMFDKPIDLKIVDNVVMVKEIFNRIALILVLL